MGNEVILVGILSLFMLSNVIALLINIKVKRRREKNCANNMSQLNKLTDEFCATESENDSELSVEKVTWDLKDISFDYSDLIRGFTERDSLQ